MQRCTQQDLGQSDNMLDSQQWKKVTNSIDKILKEDNKDSQLLLILRLIEDMTLTIRELLVMLEWQE